MTNQTRRDVLKKGLQVAAVGVGAGLIWDLFLQKSAKAQGFVPRPPGALPPDRFETACSKCGLCVEACPYDTLKLARFNDIAAPGTPFFTPRDIPCYMCRDIPCVKACPSGALSHELTDITEAKMGVAAIDHYTCLSWQGLRCEICYRDCPEQNKAIVIVSQPRQISNHAMFVPEIHPDKCTGCGLCVHSCPTDKPSINIVDPDAFLGKIGDHYRLGWKEKLDARAVPDAPMTSKDGKPLPPGGLDFLNSSSGRAPHVRRMAAPLSFYDCAPFCSVLHSARLHRYIPLRLESPRSSASCRRSFFISNL